MGRILWSLSHNPFQFNTHQPSSQGCSSLVRLDLKRCYTIWFSVLGCSDPSPVRSVAFCMLAPASCRAKDHALLRCAARIPLPYNSRLPIRFTPRKKPNYTAGILPAAQQMPKYLYTLYTLYLFLNLLCILVYSGVYSHTHAYFISHKI